MNLLEPRTWEGAIFSGDWRETPATLPVIEPATGKELARVGLADVAALDAAVVRAAQAQREWAAAPYPARMKVLRRAAELFTEHAAEIAEWAMREAGAARGFAASYGATGAEECYQAATLSSVPNGEVIPSTQPRLSFARRLPVGVVGVIAPFNAPITLAVRSIAPALAVGNAVVLKPDPRTSLVGGVVFARIFEEAGLPDGLLHVLPGGAEVGEALVKHPDVPVIAFTGSTRGGKAIAAAAAPLLKRVHLELGGNSAMIVLDDADLELAARAGAAGTFRHQGQICMATGRHLVAESLAADYVAAVTEIAESMVVGDPTQDGVTMGPLIDAGQRDRVHGLVTASLDGGARATTGAAYDELFYRPTVLTSVTESTPAYAEEVFGPVVSVMPFASAEEAVRLAAATSYGLSLGILTRDVMKGLALAERIPTGLVHINDQTINDEPGIPFGGVGESGNGARHGGLATNLEAFTEVQWVTMRATPPRY